MTMFMREPHHYGRHDPWMVREPGPSYFTDGPYVSSLEPPLSYVDFEEPPYSRFPKPEFNESPYLPLSPRPARPTSSIPAHTKSREAEEIRPRPQSKVHPEIELRVPMCCRKCEGEVRNLLHKVEGVTGVTSDRQSSKVTISGKVDPQVALKAVQKRKKKAEFWSSEIYSQAFINFVQSKTTPSPAAAEEEVNSSFREHHSEADSHHAHQEHHREYPPQFPGRDLEDPYEEMARDSPYVISRPPFAGRDAYYNQYTPSYGDMGNFAPYGTPRRSFIFHEEPEEEMNQWRRYEDQGSSYFEHRYGAHDSPHYERGSGSFYGDYGSSYGDSSSYRPSQSYGPSGLCNPNYIKRVIYDY